MKTEYKRDLQNNYLILEAPDTDADDHYGLRMAEQNQVKGLLPMHESRKDGKLYLHYEITSKQTLESIYEKRTMGYQDILYILSGIRDTLENMKKYLLSPQQLLFAPEMIYMQPERKNLLLCYYSREDECPIRMLAEFILKRLDHRDRQAVALGYGFFEHASGENFSLAETLKEILTTFDSADGADTLSASMRVGAGAEAGSWNRDGRIVMPFPDEINPDGKWADTEAAGGYRKAAEMEMPGGYSKAAEMEMFGGYRQEAAMEASERYPGTAGTDMPDGYHRVTDPEEPYVIHHKRRGSGGKEKKAGHLADLVFAKVHPVILLSFLILTVVLEILMIGNLLNLTESGGCFFLLLSVEILLNRRLLHKKASEPEEWDDEEENEEYQRMLREVFQEGAAPAIPEPVEETRCLIPKVEEETLCLVCCSGNGKETYPEIHPGSRPVYIGKIKGDVDVLLNVSTVSRMHARIQIRQGQCFLKDMNSKNGTFLNGRRLDPQEECGLLEGDKVAFAQIEYRVMKRNGIY